jgi:hypothetical protein
MLGQQLVEALEELRKSTLAIDDDAMPVVRHGQEGDDLDVRPLCGEAQAVEEGIVRVQVRPQEEHALGTAAGDHVDASGNDLSR